jgi:hypothetical protein
MTFITVWKQDFRESERLPLEVVTLLQEQGTIRSAWKPNAKGKLKPVLISLDVMSKIRDTSCQMGPRVTEGAVINDHPGFKALVKAWKPKFAVVMA